MFHRFRDTLVRPGVDLRSTHSDRLVRWMGHEAVAKISADMRGWYGPPIAVAGVPGAVFATGDGDFVGRIEAGQELSAAERFDEIVRRGNRARLKLALRHQIGGFSSLSDLINEATNGGKVRQFIYQKNGPTGVANVTSSLWRLGVMPAAGGAPGNAPGGTAQTDATTGGYPFANPTSPDTQHVVSSWGNSTTTGSSLLLYDLIFGCNKTMNSTANEAVTGVPTRYQNQTGGTPDYIGGNFWFIQVGGTALAATAHNWDNQTYTDQDGNTGITLPTVTGNASAIVDRLDHPTNQWFAPLAAGDSGVKAMTNMHCSALVATGVIWQMLGHPICWMGFPSALVITNYDYVQTAFSLPRIFDDACLALLEVSKPSSTPTTYNVWYSTVAG